MRREFDVVVVGTGVAGTTAALALRRRGRSVAVVDERPFGGTCALRGCDPKKVLVAAARAADAVSRYRDRGIFLRDPELDWSALMRFKRTFTDPVPESREREFENAGVVTFHGPARFVSADRMHVGGDEVHAAHFVIASGATERHVVDGDEKLLTSETFMELERMPESLIFIGGGYIAFEFAHVAARAGARVTILHDGDAPLHGFDRDAVERVLGATRQAGISVELESRVTAVTQRDGRVVARVKTKDGEREFEAARGVLAAGRVPDLDRLDLGAAGVERTAKGVKVDEHLKSVSNPRVYAAGDAADGGGLALTPVAEYEGEIAAANIVDGDVRAVEFSGLVTMVYTIPALGQVGLTDVQARDGGIDADVHSSDMTDWYSTQHVAAKTAYYKLVCEKNTGKLLGAAVVGPHAEEQINVLALGVRLGLERDRLAQTLFAYPTGTSDVRYM
jgi:glutathione reductase (NADPH)